MERDRIIVFQKFDSLIEANIIKTKLDAYGIPCYLTEENLTHLTTPLLSGGIRLHIFEEDRDKVEQLLMEDHLAKSDDSEIISCPRCHSKKIVNNPPNPKINQIVFRFLMGLTRLHYCIDCGNEFDD